MSSTIILSPRTAAPIGIAGTSIPAPKSPAVAAARPPAGSGGAPSPTLLQQMGVTPAMQAQASATLEKALPPPVARPIEEGQPPKMVAGVAEVVLDVCIPPAGVALRTGNAAETAINCGLTVFGAWIFGAIHALMVSYTPIRLSAPCTGGAAVPVAAPGPRPGSGRREVVRRN